jgi:hypothetical protein
VIRSLAAITLVASSLGLIAAALVSGLAEVRPYLQASAPPRQLISAISTGKLTSGFSTLSQRMTLDDCAYSMQSTLGQLLATADRNALGIACGAIAAKVVTSSPASSYGWFVTALAASQGGNLDLMNRALERSQITGPFEEWVAEDRVGLAERWYAELSPSARASHDKDLALLVRSQPGIVSIGKRYVNDAQFRDRITAIVGTMGPRDQANFLAEVRQASGAAP